MKRQQYSNVQLEVIEIQGTTFEFVRKRKFYSVLKLKIN